MSLVTNAVAQVCVWVGGAGRGGGTGLRGVGGGGARRTGGREVERGGPRVSYPVLWTSMEKAVAYFVCFAVLLIEAAMLLTCVLYELLYIIVIKVSNVACGCY